MKIKKHCIDCGREFTSGKKIQVRCKSCQYKHCIAMGNLKNAIGNITIVADPNEDEDIRYSPGAVLPDCNLRSMLLCGGLASGTVIEMANKQYRIEGMEAVRV